MSRIASLAAALLILAASQTSAGHKGKGHKDHKGKGAAKAAFSQEDRDIIRAYFEENETPGKGRGKGKGRKGLPPGLAKRKQLPPGLAERIQPGAEFPAEAAKEAQPLPLEIEAKLNILPEGHVRVVVGADIVVMDKTSRKVLDVARDIARLHYDLTK